MICEIIKSGASKKSPKNLLEKIMQDALTAYIGRVDYIENIIVLN